ncbi:PREDICTED: uncharacterized protein LOC107067310 [Polistes dominula]|uniref:Uncharacterized protein LOC107067310 n=1 Tax=Polistes dominula TaxID=743375 RepID=A0ABM1ID98_POLDO|nr:PREDICTED: uncharacterized protein LOC107067310 [Polistes dominula]
MAMEQSDLIIHDLEEQCEDAIFEVCDARERYPMLCAEELEKCIRLTNEIQTAKVVQNIKKFNDIEPLTEEQNVILYKESNKQNYPFKCKGVVIKRMKCKFDNLKMVVEQLKREKYCDINKLLNS